MALTMSDAEVARQYRAAADKRKALDIIAELNGNPGKPGRDEVTAALARQGIDVKRPYKKLDQGRVQALYDQGYSDQEIARTVGAEQDTVKAWRKRNNLRANKPLTPPEDKPKPEAEHSGDATPSAAPLATSGAGLTRGAASGETSPLPTEPKPEAEPQEAGTDAGRDISASDMSYLADSLKAYADIEVLLELGGRYEDERIREAVIQAAQAIHDGNIHQRLNGGKAP